VIAGINIKTPCHCGRAFLFSTGDSFHRIVSIFDEPAFLITCPRTSSGLVEERSNFRVIICDCVDVVDREVGGIIYIVLGLVTGKEMPTTVILHVPDPHPINGDAICRNA